MAAEKIAAKHAFKLPLHVFKLPYRSYSNQLTVIATVLFLFYNRSCRKAQKEEERWPHKLAVHLLQQGCEILLVAECTYHGMHMLPKWHVLVSRRSACGCGCNGPRTVSRAIITLLR